jgi:protein tyrosine/serine phosphatase
MKYVERSRTHVIAALLALVLSSPAAAQEPIRAITPDSITIYNFAKVNDRYYRGGQPLGEHYADLAAIGVKTIVNLTNDSDGRSEEQALAEQHGMRYVSIPMTTRKAPTEAQIAQFMSIVDDPNGGAVYVHCVGGRHRTGVMTAVYRMTRDGITGEQAFKEMKQHKYGPDFLHPEFKKFVYQYQPKPAVAVAASQQ